MAAYTDGTKLYATSIAELHDFAASIGLPHTLFVEDGLNVYYYIGGGNPALLKAMANGAQCIHPHQLNYVKRDFKKYNR